MKFTQTKQKPNPVRKLGDKQCDRLSVMAETIIGRNRPAGQAPDGFMGLGQMTSVLPFRPFRRYQAKIQIPTDKCRQDIQSGTDGFIWISKTDSDTIRIRVDAVASNEQKTTFLLTIRSVLSMAPEKAIEEVRKCLTQ